jgi:hypothetical protein
MERVGIMIRRIREQMSGLPQLQGTGTIRLTAEAVGPNLASAGQTLEQQVRSIANRVNEMILTSLGNQQTQADVEGGNTKEGGHGSSNGN